MLNFDYQPDAHTAPNAADFAGDKWDADNEITREVAYFTRLAFSNPEDAATRQAQRWLADYQREQDRINAA